MERPPGQGAALCPSCRHKYLALHEQLPTFPSTTGTRSWGSPPQRGREAKKGVRLSLPFSG